MTKREEELTRTYSKWYQEYGLPIFATLSMPKSYLPRREDFKPAHRSIGRALKKLGRTAGAPPAALGFIVVSPADHIHSHLLVGGELMHWRADVATAAKALDQLWRYNSKVEVARSVEDVARYICDAHHLVTSKSHDFFSHGPNVLKRIRCTREVQHRG